MDKLINIITGEFVFKHMPNGGAAVLLRTTYISFFIYSLTIGLKSYASNFSVFEFSSEQLLHEVSETIPWLGAILGAVYAALYARFASQWSYLSGLYNQQMEV
ncbi:MAG: hypothetical protein V4732_04420 [Pseudomonadota bacterium]